MSSLLVIPKLTNDVLKLVLKGHINETTQLGDYPYERLNEIYIDLEGVELITSTGVRLWVQWIRKIMVAKSSIRFVFFHVKENIIDQMNGIKGFLPNEFLVRSFEAPYYCKACDRVKHKEFTINNNYKEGTKEAPGKINVPPFSCPYCGKDMELDVVQKKYFQFLTPYLKKK